MHRELWTTFYKTMKQASIDFETRSRIDLKKSGLRRYAEDESTDILCMSYEIWGSGYVYTWLPGQPFPADLLNVGMNHAWNAQFEIEIWNKVATRRYGWLVTDIRSWHDTMGDAAMCGFPLHLGKCAEALGVSDQKDASGTRLINLLSKPRKDGLFNEYADMPEEFNRMYRYCEQDVRTEHAVHDALPAHVAGVEAEVQYATWISNGRGLPVDITSVRSIDTLINEYTTQLDSQVAEITNGALKSARQRDALLLHLEMNNPVASEYVIEREKAKAQHKESNALLPKKDRVRFPVLSVKKIPGITLPNLQGETVDEVLKSWDISRYDRVLLEIRQAINHASVAKFKKILMQVCADNTVKDNIQYHGAGTGRDAARGFQMQNLPRDTEKDPDKLLSFMLHCPLKELKLLFDILKSASRLIRPMIQAPYGKKFLCSDYGQVEARGASWAAKEENILDNFRAGIDPYVAQAASMYQLNMEEIDKGKRQYGKLAILACGFQGAHKALTDFALDYGLELERSTAVEVVDKFRASRPKLCAAWEAFNEAARAALLYPGEAFQVQECQHAVFQMRGPHLTLELPSTRKLWYPYAKLQDVVVKYEDRNGKKSSFKTNAVTSMWVSSYTGRWERRGMSGGKFFQNYDQAICRDLLMNAILNLEAEGYHVVGRIHDEALCCVPDDNRYTAQEMDAIMERRPDWAVGFPLVADGYESMRYRK